MQDKFDNLMQKMAAMPESEQKALVEENRAMCVCESCPSYTQCMEEHGELLYCSEGKSRDCKVELMGCICPSCPVMLSMGLTKAYYCMRGSEVEQRKKE
jgi:hypothetical protein